MVIGRESTCRNGAVNVGMQKQVLSPSMQDADHADLGAPPTITSAPLGVTYGGTFTVLTPKTDIASVVLIKPGSVTHSFDMDRRLVGLSFTAVTGGLTATVPSNSNLTPPGYYMLFVVNQAGVPSVASFVHISGALAPVAAMAFRPLKAAPLHPAHMLHVTESPLPWRGKMH